MSKSGEDLPGGSTWFDDASARRDLRRRTVHSALFSVASRVGGQVISLLGAVILARILSPADFGVMGMVVAVIGVSVVLQDLGLSAATIRFRGITSAQVSNLFWVNFGVGCAMAVAAVLLAPAIARFYRDARVGDAAQIMALGFALSGAITQHLALLRRAMRFGELANISVVSGLANVIVALAWALAGAGYWAPIAGWLAGEVLTVVMAWRYCDWRPGPPRRGVGTRALLVFGLSFGVFGLLGFIAKNVHSLIIGRLWGATEAGLYGRANTMRTLLIGNIVQPLGLVSPSAMSSLAGEKEKFCEYYYKGCTVLVIAAMPTVFVSAVLPHEFVTVLFGAQWGYTAVLLQLMAVGIVPQVILHTTGWVYLSAGKSARMMWWGIVSWSAVIAGTLVGSKFGLEGIAVAGALTALLLVAPGLQLAFAGTPLGVLQVLRAVFPGMGAAMVAGISATAMLNSAGALPGWARLLCGTALFLGIYIVMLMTVFRQRALVMEIVAQLRARATSQGQPA